MAIESLEYGAVLFVKGEFKGKLGYYDNEEGDGAVVYLGKPFDSEYVTVPFSDIRNMTSLEHEKFKKENPEYCKTMGID